MSPGRTFTGTGAYCSVAGMTMNRPRGYSSTLFGIPTKATDQRPRGPIRTCSSRSMICRRAVRAVRFQARLPPYGQVVCARPRHHRFADPISALPRSPTKQGSRCAAYRSSVRSAARPAVNSSIRFAWIPVAHLMHRRGLLGASRPLSDIAYACGFRDYTHFARKFRQQFGCAPGAHAGRHGQRAGNGTARVTGLRGPTGDLNPFAIGRHKVQ